MQHLPQHEIRKKENEHTRLQERLNQLLTDKDRAFKAGIEILNTLQKQGPRATWGPARKVYVSCSHAGHFFVKCFALSGRSLVSTCLVLRNIFCMVWNQYLADWRFRAFVCHTRRRKKMAQGDCNRAGGEAEAATARERRLARTMRTLQTELQDALTRNSTALLPYVSHFLFFACSLCNNQLICFVLVCALFCVCVCAFYRRVFCPRRGSICRSM